MDFGEYKDLQAQVADIHARDFHLGQFLYGLLLHVAHGNGLDAEKEQAKADAEARKQARDEEDAQLKADADARTQARAAEDAQPMNPEQKTALDARRAQEDEQLKAEADARAKQRADEDAAAKDAQGAPPAKEGKK